MNIGDIVGQMMRSGLSPSTQGRLDHAVGEQGLGGLGDVLNNVLGGAGGTGSGGALGGLLGSLSGAMSADSGVGGLSRGQVGGIGALAGAILGGGSSSVKGAVGGGAMAILGTLAMSALQNWQQSQGSPGASTPALSGTDVQRMTAPETAELCLRGMIEAIKSDGNIAPEEVQRIVGKIEEGGITSEEQQFVTRHLQGPPDVRGLLAAIPSREVGAQVYAAALMAISVDTPAERTFLANLAQGVGLDPHTVQRLHAMVGAPAPA